ncbi:hypothetical protein RIF29_08843 [Crotalaria pallida]|uniref:Uncharacterized protein n=1 Tax=Crotalaria pallida TaxID=3830 RepID=A0AAN9FRC5_CROPI
MQVNPLLWLQMDVVASITMGFLSPYLSLVEMVAMYGFDNMAVAIRFKAVVLASDGSDASNASSDEGRW